MLFTGLYRLYVYVYVYDCMLLGGSFQGQGNSIFVSVSASSSLLLSFTINTILSRPKLNEVKNQFNIETLILSLIVW